MRRAQPYVLAGLLAFLVFSVLQLPAGVLLGRIDPGQRWLSGPVSGTAWSGQATLSLRGSALGRLDWRLAPAALLRGRLRLDATLAGPDTAADLQLERSLWGGHWSAGDGHLRLPAERLPALLPLPLALHGQLQGDIERFEITPDGAPRLDAVLHWRQAGIALDRAWALGTVTLRSEPAAEGSRIVLDGQGGAVLPAGELTLTAHGYRSDIALLPRTDAARAALRGYGAKGPGGRLQLTYQDRW
jgi:hypothetical protein